MAVRPTATAPAATFRAMLSDRASMSVVEVAETVTPLLVEVITEFSISARVWLEMSFLEPERTKVSDPATVPAATERLPATVLATIVEPSPAVTDMRPKAVTPSLDSLRSGILASVTLSIWFKVSTPMPEPPIATVPAVTPNDAAAAVASISAMLWALKAMPPPEEEISEVSMVARVWLAMVLVAVDALKVTLIATVPALTEKVAARVSALMAELSVAVTWMSPVAVKVSPGSLPQLTMRASMVLLMVLSVMPTTTTAPIPTVPSATLSDAARAREWMSASDPAAMETLPVEVTLALSINASVSLAISFREMEKPRESETLTSVAAIARVPTAVSDLVTASSLAVTDTSPTLVNVASRITASVVVVIAFTAAAPAPTSASATLSPAANPPEMPRVRASMRAFDSAVSATLPASTAVVASRIAARTTCPRPGSLPMVF